MTRLTEVVSASPGAIARAAEILRAGGLVAFPTETVYGLGANALDAAAVEGIFRAKGRPATNPVIVHVAEFAQLGDVARDVPPLASALANRFWPGPLTLVVPRGERTPDVVAAGGPTVAVRVPAHPVAQELLRACRIPLAAPSANRSTCLSPTRTVHVLRGLDGRIDMALDAGPCPHGLESTVLDLTTDPPTLLRPGPIRLRDLEAIVGEVTRRPPKGDGIVRSPGMSSRHYSPTTPIEFAADSGEARVRELQAERKRIGWLTFLPVSQSGWSGVAVEVMPEEPRDYASKLYDALHRLDEEKLERIVIALPPEDDDWLAIHDRLGRMT